MKLRRHREAERWERQRCGGKRDRQREREREALFERMEASEKMPNMGMG